MACEPTFVIAGGQRCGTTWLYHLLEQHPEIHLAAPVRPEPKLFLEEVTPARLERYLETYFAGAGDALARGEKSVSYLDHPDAPRRMKETFPELRVVAILRHPLERAISNYRFSCTHGLETDTLDHALRHESERVAATRFPGVSSHPLAYLWRSDYATFLEAYRRHFDAARMHVLIKDDLDREPLGELRRLFRFLGVDESFAPTGLADRINATDEQDATLDAGLAGELLERLTPGIRRLAKLIGRDLDAWTRPSPAVRRLMRKR